MAMKVAPSPSSAKDPEIIRTSFGILSVQSDEELNQLSKVVSDVIYHGKPHRSKHSPRVNKPKMKAKKKSKPAKVPVSPSVATKPVLPTVSVKTIKDDSERYAMWWSFHTDLSKGEYPKYKGIKVVKYPVDPADRAAGERKMRLSNASRKSIDNVRALGTTPRNHQGPTGLIGSVPHAGDPAFKEVVLRNSEYEKELISRYVTRSVIASTTFIRYPEHLSITRDRTNTSGNDCVNVDEMISKLEQHIAEAPVKTAKVEAVTTKQMRFDDRVARAEAKALDLDLSDVLAGRYYNPPVNVDTSAANDQSFVMAGISETPSEKDQLPTAQQYLQERKLEPLMGDEYADYCKALHRMEKRSDTAHQLHFGPYEMDSRELYQEDRRQAARYMGWLHRHDVHNAVRTSVEHARRTALPAYEMQVGIDVPAVYHLGNWAYNGFVKSQIPRRIAAFDYGLLTNDSFSNVMKRTNNQLGTTLTPVDVPIVDVTVLDQEELVNKIVDNAVERHRNKMTFSEWNQSIANFIEYCKEEPTTESESSPSDVPYKGAYAFVHNHKRKPVVTEKSAEIVSLSVVRNERADGMSKLLSAIKPKLAGLTPEQEEGARIVLKEMLEMLG